MKQRKGGPVKSQRKEQIILDLCKLIMERQIQGMSLEEIQQTYFQDVSRQTLSSYLSEAYERVFEDYIGEGTISLYINQIGHLHKRALRYGNRLLDEMDNMENHKDQINTISNVSKLINSYSDLLENTGILPAYREEQMRKARMKNNVEVRVNYDNL